MAIWLVRGGRFGEYESAFFQDNRVYLTWQGLGSYDLSKVETSEELRSILIEAYPDEKPGAIRNYIGQIMGFLRGISVGDWVVVPQKNKPFIAIGEVIGSIRYDKQATEPFWFWHDVKWIDKEIPRSRFDQDLLYSFGAFMTVCKIQRNDAEIRIRQMATAGWLSNISTSISSGDSESITYEPEQSNLEDVGMDQIRKLLDRRFRGHGLERVIDAILKAQGYTTYHSPKGVDGGIDILASPGPLGFGSPKLCVQVKSQDSPLDRPTLDQLIGTMQNVGAEHGLLVAWNGFKSSIDQVAAAQFFRVRLWDQNDVIRELLVEYENLDESLKSEIPLKQIWTIAAAEDEE
ncbi:MAG: restriction endonuclease [Acidobacteria bacterium]|nr:restriction endonuclease [Acidobacteriota bacterium]